VKVLYANHTARVSGGEHSLLGLLESLPPEVEAAVACPEGELAERVRERGLPVFPLRGTDASLRLSPTGTALALAEMGWAAAQLRIAARRFGADVVHANSVRAGLLATGPGIAPAVVHVRDCLPPGRASRLALRRVAAADAVIANSAYTRATLGPAAARARVVHNAVDLSRFERMPAPAVARVRLGLGGDGPVLAVIAQITPWKGQDDAIEILAALRHRHPGAQLLLVGSVRFDAAATRFDNTAYLARLRERIAELGLEGRVRLLGQRDDVPEILAAADLLLAPSWEEPFGRSIVEAMAAGVPVIATDVGGPAEILARDRTGFLLPPRRPWLWVETIERLLDAPEVLLAIGQRARDDARLRFGADRHRDQVTAVYRELSSATGCEAAASRSRA
jgi:L-malate glycosyltransferase